MNSLKFGVPTILPPTQSTLEVDFPYNWKDSPHIIKVMAAESMVKNWVDSEQSIINLMEERARKFIMAKLEQDSLNDHELLVLTADNNGTGAQAPQSI
ncbi:MAG: hypothetical protein ACM3X9_10185 [Bacillota bacterium]